MNYAAGAVSLQQEATGVRDKPEEDKWLCTRASRCGDQMIKIDKKDSLLLFMRFVASSSDQNQAASQIFSPSDNFVTALTRWKPNSVLCGKARSALMILMRKSEELWRRLISRSSEWDEYNSVTELLWMIALGGSLLRQKNDFMKRTSDGKLLEIKSEMPGVGMFFCFPGGLRQRVVFASDSTEIIEVPGRCCYDMIEPTFTTDEKDERDGVVRFMNDYESMQMELVHMWLIWLKKRSHSAHGDSLIFSRMRFVSLVWLLGMRKAKNTKRLIKQMEGDYARFSSCETFDMVLGGRDDDVCPVLGALSEQFGHLGGECGQNLKLHVHFVNIVTSAIALSMSWTKSKDGEIDDFQRAALTCFPRAHGYKLNNGFASREVCDSDTGGRVEEMENFRWSSLEMHFVAITCMSMNMWPTPRTMIGVAYLHKHENQHITTIQNMAKSADRRHVKNVQELFRGTDVTRQQTEALAKVLSDTERKVHGTLRSTSLVTGPKCGYSPTECSVDMSTPMAIVEPRTPRKRGRSNLSGSDIPTKRLMADDRQHDDVPSPHVHHDEDMTNSTTRNDDDRTVPVSPCMLDDTVDPTETEAESSAVLADDRDQDDDTNGQRDAEARISAIPEEESDNDDETNDPPSDTETKRDLTDAGSDDDQTEVSNALHLFFESSEDGTAPNIPDAGNRVKTPSRDRHVAGGDESVASSSPSSDTEDTRGKGFKDISVPLTKDTDSGGRDASTGGDTVQRRPHTVRETDGLHDVDRHSECTEDELSPEEEDWPGTGQMSSNEKVREYLETAHVGVDDAQMLRNQLDVKSREYTCLSKQLSITTTNNTILESDKEMLERRLEGQKDLLKRTEDRYQERLLDLTTKMTAAEDDITTVSSERDEQRKKLQLLNQTLTERNDMISQLREKLGNQSVDTSREEANDTLLQENALLKAQLNDANTQSQSLVQVKQQELPLLTNTPTDEVQKLGREMQQLVHMNAQLQEQLRVSIKKNDLMESQQNTCMATDSPALRTEVAQLQDLLQRYTTEAEEKGADVDRLNRRLEEKERRISHLTEENERNSYSRREWQAEADRTLSRLNSDLAKRDGMIIELTSQAELLKKQVDMHREREEKLQGAVEEATKAEWDNGRRVKVLEEEEKTSALRKKKIEEMEAEMRRMRDLHDKEKTSLQDYIDGERKKCADLSSQVGILGHEKRLLVNDVEQLRQEQNVSTSKEHENQSSAQVLASQNSIMARTLNDLQTDLDRTNDEKDQLETNLKQQLDRNADRLTDMQEKLEKKDEENQDLKCDKKRQSETVQSLQHTIEKNCADMEEMHHQMKELERQFGLCGKADCSTQVCMKDDLTRKVEASAREELGHVHEVLDMLTKTLSKPDEADAMSLSHETWDSDVKRLASRVQDMLSRHYISLVKEAKNISTATEINDSIKKLREELDRSVKVLVDKYTLSRKRDEAAMRQDSDVKNLKEKLIDASQQRQTAETRVTRLKEQLEELAKDNAHLKDDRDGLRSTNATLLSQAEQVNRDVNKTFYDRHHDETVMKRKISELEGRVEVMGSTIREKDAAMQKLGRQNARLSDEGERARARAVDSETATQRLRSMVEDLTSVGDGSEVRIPDPLIAEMGRDIQELRELINVTISRPEGMYLVFIIVLFILSCQNMTSTPKSDAVAQCSWHESHPEAEKNRDDEDCLRSDEDEVVRRKPSSKKKSRPPRNSRTVKEKVTSSKKKKEKKKLHRPNRPWQE